MRDNGTVIFKRVFNEKVDAQLFGGFMSALNTVASQMSESSGITSFEIGDKRFYVIRKDGMMFIANSEVKVKSKEALKDLDNVVTKFFGTYPSDMINAWNGDLSFFDNFEHEINETLEDRALKMLKSSLWI